MTAPTGYDYTQTLLPASDATIQPMKGGGSEASDFYTAFIGGLKLEGYDIQNSEKTVTLSSKKLPQFYAAPAKAKGGGYILQRRGKDM
jgi:hypothetical protein